MEYTNPHTLPPYVTFDTYTRADGALYIHARDEILNTNTAATVDPLEWPCASLRDRLFDNLVHQLTHERARVAAALYDVVSRGLLPCAEDMCARQILQAMGETRGLEYVPLWGHADTTEDHEIIAECASYEEYTIKAQLRGRSPLCREDYVLIVEYRKVAQKYLNHS